MPEVSVITPCYNCARFIGETIESVRAQTFPHWEQVVVDDGSPDEAATVVACNAARDTRVRLVRQFNSGVCRARNVGFATSSPESAYLLFLDADDVLEPQMLELMVAYLEAHAEVGMVHCGSSFIDAEGREIDRASGSVGWVPRYVPEGLWVRELPPTCPETPFVSVFAPAGIVPSLALIRRAVYARIPGWDEALGQHYEDADLFLQIALRSRIHYLPRPLVRHRRHAAQSSADTRKYGVQEEKLYAKWRRGIGLTAEEMAVVEAAWRFREGRLVPYQAVASGKRHLRRGEFGSAARFYLGAARRYLASFAPPAARWVPAAYGDQR
jgi:glycosyltransferase involved in cell wall biosynthesis